jgi:hypothetical protein
MNKQNLANLDFLRINPSAENTRSQKRQSQKKVQVNKKFDFKKPNDIFWTIQEVERYIKRLKRYPEKNKSLIEGMEAHLQKWTGEMELNAGWLMPYFTEVEGMFWGRWKYRFSLQSVPTHLAHKLEFYRMRASVDPSVSHLLDKTANEIADEIITTPIPPISFSFNKDVKANLENCLRVIPKKGYYNENNRIEYLEYFLHWFFYAVDHPAYREKPEEPRGCEGAFLRIYQIFDWCAFMHYPYDYMSELVSGIYSKGQKQGQGYFPTPMNVTQMMNDVLHGDNKHLIGSKLIESVGEPAVGCGATLLPASNRSLVAVGYDIDPLLLKCALFSFYFYAPWYAMPLWWTNPISDLIHGDSLDFDPSNFTSMNAKHWYKDGQ